MNRREFVVSAAAAAAGLAATPRPLPPEVPTTSGKSRFKLKYAPHFGMFRHHAGEDLVDQLKFVSDEGFRAFEDNGMMQRPVEVQEKLAREMDRLGIQMGVFVASADFGAVTFASADSAKREKILGEMRQAVEVARRVNARWCTVVPGRFDEGLEWGYQTANVVENLKRCCEILEPEGVTMVLEPLNPWKDHPGLFLTKIPQAYQICRAVGSPSCKILFDLYHQQITEGNLIPNLERSWAEIAYFQVGDNPGRNEPTTGEIHYRNVFRAIHAHGYDGVVGMEHGNSQPGKAGERRVIEAYLESDAF